MLNALTLRESPLPTSLRTWLRDLEPVRVAFLAYGFMPILSLSLALQGLIPLHLAAGLVLLPATAAMLLAGVAYPAAGRAALHGLLSGIVAVAAYDVVRIACVLAGLMPDPIPNIGRMALDDPGATWIWGYVWRFLWNGGTMGIAFSMLPLRGPRLGVAFGLFVCGCLFVTLAVSPLAQQRFLVLNARNIVIATAGHIVYGATLGWALDRLARRS